VKAEETWQEEGEIRIALFKAGEQKETNSLWKLGHKQGKMNTHVEMRRRQGVHKGL